MLSRPRRLPAGPLQWLPAGPAQRLPAGPLQRLPAGPVRRLRVGPRRGLTLIELAVVLAVMTLLLNLAAPAFATWTRNAQVRAASESLQGVLRQAQADAASRSRQVVVFRTADAACDGSTGSAASGMTLAIRTVGLVSGETGETLRCSRLAEGAGAITLAGPQALCFNSAGRLVANAAPGVTGAVCAAPVAGAMSSFDIAATGADRPLRVLVSPGGMVRSCDPARSLAAGQPDGCPS